MPVVKNTSLANPAFIDLMDIHFGFLNGRNLNLNCDDRNYIQSLVRKNINNPKLASVSIYINHSSLSSEVIEDIKKLFQLNTNITSLDLSKPTTDAYGNILLDILDLSIGTNFTVGAGLATQKEVHIKDSVKQLLEVVGKTQKITKLNLKNIDASGTQIMSILEAVKSEEITSLNLQSNMKMGADQVRLAQIVEKCPKLQFINIKFSGFNAQEITNVLNLKHNLGVHVNLGSNNVAVYQPFIEANKTAYNTSLNAAILLHIPVNPLYELITAYSEPSDTFLLGHCYADEYGNYIE